FAALMASMNSAPVFAAAPAPGYRLLVLPPLPGQPDSGAEDVNNAGIVAGASFGTVARSTKWVNGKPIEISVGLSEADSINNLGHFAGTLSLGGGGAHGYFYDGVTIRDVHNATLGTVGDFSVALSVNDSDQIAGWAATSGASQRSAYLWQNGAATLLGT